tara:strand:+ start:2612 stop:4627 length:2016 start_codon:yes stop_codon:yes gene_type:complete
VAESIVTLRVEARNAISSLNKTSQATRTLSRNANGASRSLAATSTAARGLGSALATSLGPLLTVGAAVATVSNAIGTFTARERDVAILTQGLQNLGAGTAQLNELQEAADRLGNQTLFNQEEFTRGFNLLTSFRNIGVDSYSRVAQAAADIAQVNQVDVSTSFMQLAKALQDPERNLSNLNRSGIAFTKQQTEVIKELMKTNKIAEAHAMILSIVEESYNGLAQAASEGFAGEVDTLGESFRDFSETLGKALEPALIQATKGLTALITAADNLFKSPLGKTAALFTAIALAAKGVIIALPIISAGLLKVAAAGGIATIALNAIPFVAIATAAGLLTTAFFKLNGVKKEFNNLINEGGEADVKQALEDQEEVIKRIDEQLNQSGKRSKTRLFQKKAEAEQERKMLQDRLKSIESDNKIEEAKNNIVALKEKENKLEEDQTKKFQDFLKKQQLAKELLQASIDGNREEVELQHAINAAVEIHGEKNRQKITDILTANLGLKNQKTEIDKINEASQRQAEVFAEIGRTIGTQITDALVGAINGTKSLGESAKAILNDLANSLLRMGINSMLGGLFGGTKIGGFLGFANGGRPPVGRASVVGEKGPELFVPSTAGTIIPNDRIGGGVTNNIVVNVDASGSNVEGNEQESRELGLVISAAIQAQLVQEKRPGGLLA